jgi:3D (Asp-Asp-Asp) domain-containing protein
VSNVKKLTRKLLPFYVLAAAAVGVSTVMSTAATAASSSAAGTAQATSSLPACPFWAGNVTPPNRPVTPWVPPLQTAPALNFSTRMEAPTLTGTLVNGQVDLTVSRVPGAVAYRIWRDGVPVAWIDDWGQASITTVDTAPCQNAFYQVVTLSNNSGSDASMGQLSRPYWLGSNGTLALGPASPPVGTTINMLVTSYNNGGQTASGYNTTIGMCATDPRVIPWGTYFTVPGYGTCFAGDIGTWISNDTVDLWLPGSQANGWGVQDRTITIIADPYPASSSP